MLQACKELDQAEASKANVMPLLEGATHAAYYQFKDRPVDYLALCWLSDLSIIPPSSHLLTITEHAIRRSGTIFFSIYFFAPLKSMEYIKYTSKEYIVDSRTEMKVLIYSPDGVSA